MGDNKNELLASGKSGNTALQNQIHDWQNASNARQLITFHIGEQFFGVDIMAIREIRAWSPATNLPNVPNYVRGVVNLRGVVLPVFDLRQRLGWGMTEPTARHVIIVVNIGDQLQGLIVDAVNDIVTARNENMQPVPDVGESSAARFLEGLVTIDDRMIMVLALDRLRENNLHLQEQPPE
ncbi:MAG: chemotaxis protein CheW [Zymomonas mobilis subsp. pomaceae]|uniref:CheW protein n=1 Tax=Zymomonas mobilis subsp. pomaceae (strain ATCC 29192 / DSM 22645 / JCM 10191 / CCUG 17912 / NBRC 13757 / NCIMB 11200 / NRRL B-4491 / Barker I) TaxID=579138 RepID=F8ETH6_ZYMMT|nr:chemotaxis protein CheW [Zymomonas mobilis]AEI38001.1 CheW protein [Zymomonas mobilis subsp. pomaceae ATCC 29192]MDX5949369.1 chemotaxis protein CheW [Zymomonas mobilis subsp. pomaceae]GEB89111.1 chemotaxis protein CheW [Zymomonas mobilis subsp. pomaceae]